MRPPGVARAALPADMDGMPRLRLPELAAFAVTVLGLVLLAQALDGATPVVYFGTDEEIADRERGQALLVPAGAVLALAAAGLAWQRRFAHAVFVAAPAVLCVALAKAYPDALYGGLAFLCLAPAAFAAALAASFTRRRPARSSSG
jgi:hypothetical protein